MILELLKKRSSVRNFSNKKISKDIMMYILEAGRLSPSGGNEQPWKFGVITDRNIIKSISELAYKQKWIADAKLIIVLCSKIVSDDRGGRGIQKFRFPEIATEIDVMDKEIYSKLNQEEHQTKIPGTHMVIAATEHGIGSTWVSYFKVNQLTKLLNIPSSYIPGEIIAFGYPVKTIKPVKKKSLEEVVFYPRANCR